MNTRTLLAKLFLCILLLAVIPSSRVSYRTAVGEDETALLIDSLRRDYSYNRAASRLMKKGRLPDREQISPYDNLIKTNARHIDWDWRLLAALIYHESRFTPEANSHKGAVGLMQIRSSRYPVDSLLVPSINLEVGCNYLRRLENMFSRYAASPGELVKYTLAAYNAGEGRVLQGIQIARSLGMDDSHWSSVAEAMTYIPGFNEAPCIQYVESILNTYYVYYNYYPD